MSEFFFYNIPMKKVVHPIFFERPTLVVAKNLLGKFLVRRRGKRISAYMITEVEVYDGYRDKASHASRGQTARNAPMFGPAGHWYVYFTYGMHWMLNIVTREKGYPAAVLIRGVSPVRGPARLTKKLHIDNKLNGRAATRASGLWIEDRGARVLPRAIKKSPRIGIDHAGEYWARRNLRFYLAGSELETVKPRRR